MSSLGSFFHPHFYWFYNFTNISTGIQFWCHLQHTSLLPTAPVITFFSFSPPPPLLYLLQNKYIPAVNSGAFSAMKSVIEVWDSKISHSYKYLLQICDKNFIWFSMSFFQPEIRLSLATTFSMFTNKNILACIFLSSAL